LEYFARNPHRVLSRAQTLSAVWDYDFNPGSNVVEAYVRHLREKLDRTQAFAARRTRRSDGRGRTVEALGRRSESGRAC
jgi:DNA-binding response OmpR family regulator